MKRRASSKSLKRNVGPAASALTRLRLFSKSARTATVRGTECVLLTLPGARRLATLLETGARNTNWVNEMQVERDQADAARERAEMHVDALKTIMRTYKVPVPGDPSPEPAPRGPRLARMPGSFEGGKRR